MKQFRNTQYWVTETGLIYNTITKRYIKPISKLFSKNSCKRLMVGLYINGKQRNFLYHRVLAEVFIPNPDNHPQVNHIDGNPINNQLSNLEWCSAARNNIHAIRTGLRSTKLNMYKADEIRELLSKGISVTEICKKYSVGRTIIGKIKANISWKK